MLSFLCSRSYLEEAMLVPLRTAMMVVRHAKMRGMPVQLGAIRHRMVWGDDARGPEVPVGARQGAPEDPELHTFDGHYNGTPGKGDMIPDYWYRRPTMGQTYIDKIISTFISALMWAWFSYHMYYHSGHLFGHWYMPYLHEFTDKELGIPPDSAADPAYWGHHKDQFGTYR